MNKREAIERYYACYRNKDRDTLTDLLVEDFQFTSSYACYTNRDEMLDEIWPHVLENESRLGKLEVFGEGDRFMVRYELVGAASMSEFVRFEGERIAEIEVYMGKSSGN